jgi:hypothetical protein
MVFRGEGDGFFEKRCTDTNELTKATRKSCHLTDKGKLDAKTNHRDPDGSRPAARVE